MGDYSIIMQYRDIVLGHSHLSRLLITQRFLTSVGMTIRSNNWHKWILTATVNCAPMGHSILRLWRGPFGFIGRRPGGQVRRLFGWSQTR